MFAWGLFATSAAVSAFQLNRRRSREPTNATDDSKPRTRGASTGGEEGITRKIVKKFVITGGPCSGKTTAMERLQVFLRERGFRVFVAPEAATILFLNGASVDDLSNPNCELAFQNFVIKTQMTFEDALAFYGAQTDQNCVLLCDRGLMDGSAYVTPEQWDQTLARVGLDTVSARDSRYDAVFHLVTAADGAEQFYTLANNKARHEGIEEAIDQDRRTQGAWTGHPHHVIIDNKNGKSFESKMQELVGALSTYVGLPSLTRRSRKYRLLSPPDVSLLPDAHVFDVEKVMLDSALFDDKSFVGSPRAEEGSKVLYGFVRKRSQGAFHSYGLTTVSQLKSGEKIELKQVISAKMYAMLKNSADKSRTIVRQRRYYFLWEKQSFHIYEYRSPDNGLWTLQCQCQDEPVFPSFLNVGPEIKENDESVSSYHLSKKK